MSNSHFRILAIDDTPANLLTLGTALADEYDLQIATDGEQGLALAAAAPPDLILLDLMMPGIDGFEVCRRLKSHVKLKDIPVIIVSALNEVDTEAAGLALGAADYMTKPINVKLARQRIRNLLERDEWRKKVERQLVRIRRQEQHLTLLLDLLTDGLLEIDPDGQVVRANRSAHALLDVPVGNLDGLQFDHDLLRAQLCGDVIRRFGENLRDSGFAACECQWIYRDGSERVLSIAGKALPGRGPGHAIVTLRDVTEERRQGEQLLRMAFSDPLTGLPNRLLLTDRIEQAIARARRSGYLVVLVFMDLDGFKSLNDTRGHEVGDLALQQFAVRIQEALRGTDTVARLGGDEFVVVLSDVADFFGLPRQLERLAEIAARPYELAGSRQFLGVSMGTSMFPHDGDHPAELLRVADHRMYAEKQRKARRRN